MKMFVNDIEPYGLIWALHWSWIRKRVLFRDTSLNLFSHYLKSDQSWMAGVGKAGDHLPNVIRTPPTLHTFPTGGERRRGRRGIRASDQPPTQGFNVGQREKAGILIGTPPSRSLPSSDAAGWICSWGARSWIRQGVSPRSHFLIARY